MQPSATKAGCRLAKSWRQARLFHCMISLPQRTPTYPPATVHGLGQALGDLGHALAEGLGNEVFDGVAVHFLGRAPRDQEIGVGLVHIDAGAGLQAEVVFQEFDEQGGSRNGWLREVSPPSVSRPLVLSAWCRSLPCWP
jgi:hypothetical protein